MPEMFDHDLIVELQPYVDGFRTALAELVIVADALTTERPELREGVLRAAQALAEAEQLGRLARVRGEERWLAAPPESRRSDRPLIPDRDESG